MQNKNMKKFIQLFQVKRDEWCASAIALVVFIILHAMFIYKYYEVFTQTGRGHWNIFVKHFNVSGFDVITYSMVTYWEPNYNVYRHPLLSFMVWPLSCLDKWLADLTGMNLVQFIMAVPLLLCAFYSFVFLYRIFKEIIQLRKADCMLLSAFFFSLAYIMLSVFVPDHFGISLFLLLFTIYLAGSKMQRGVPFKLWQTLVLFFLTAGVTLSNGVKTYLYVLFTNGWRFLRPKHLLIAVLLPCALIWGFARWEYRTFVWPKEMARKEIKAKKSAEQRAKALKAFSDTTSIKDTTELKKAFEQEMNRRAKQKFIADHKKPWNKHTGTPMAKGEFIGWTDISTSRPATIVENLFGESLQLHSSYLLQDTLRSRPVVVPYDWAINYIVEALIAVLFLAGIWMGRRSKFLWMILSGFIFDMTLHLVLGFGINEVYIMTAHWAFVIPLAIAFLVKAAGHTPHALKLRILLTALTLWLWGYNGILLGGYLLN